MNQTRRRQHTALHPLEPRRLLATLVGSELRIEGTAGNDRIRVETVGQNVVVTQNGSAQSFGKKAVRTINANLRRGNDRIDIVWNVNATTTISGEAGNDTILGGDYKDAIYTGSGNDAVYGNRGGDFIQTGDGDDYVAPGFGNDTVDVGNGNDHVTYRDRSTPIRADMAVRYTIDRTTTPATFATPSTTTVMAGSEADTISKAETFTGGRGNDTLSLRAAADGSGSTPWADVVSGRRFRMNGDEGADTISVNSIYDGLTATRTVSLIGDGGAGSDLFYNSISDVGLPVTLIGGDGNDEFSLNATDSGIPVVEPGGGDDKVVISKGFSLRYTMPAGLESILGDSPNGSVSITGNELDNVIIVLGNADAATVTGGGGNDRIETRGSVSLNADGGAGNDTIYGSEGNDSILGGAGDDCIDGGLGIDSIFGGTGTDRAKRDPADAVVDSIEVIV